MKKETLDKAKEIEQQIKYYDEIAYAMTYPWQRFKLTGKHAYIGATKHPYNIEVSLNDKQLAEIIELYCKTKKLDLQKELEEL
jgi:hypothetical protein